MTNGIKRYSGTVLCLVIVCAGIFADYTFGKDYSRKDTLKDIYMDIDSYTGRILTMQLKLKHYDKVFKKIIFYDRKNNDIIFNVSEALSGESFKKALMNLHRGMEYIVEFRVIGKGSLGYIVGEIINVFPVVMEKLP